MANYINAYEVIRIINTKPLFVKAHFERFISTINTFDLDINFSYEEFIILIHNIVKGNSIIDGNIRIDAIFDPEKSEINFFSKQVPHKYPTESNYKNGVKTCTFNYNRHNPNDKIWNENHRKYIDEIIKEKHVYEVIYIDNEGNITEGSRSNIFFIKENILYSPLLSQILPGITRKYIIEIAEKSGLKLEERKITFKEIQSFDSAFISGTSPKILPIYNIDEMIYDVNGLKLRELMFNFNKFIEIDIMEFEYRI